MSLKFREMTDRNIREVWEKGELSQLSNYYVGDYVRHSPPMPDLVSREELKEFIRDSVEAYSDRHFDIQEYVEIGNTVCARGVFHATHTGHSQAFNIPPTGKKIQMSFILMSHVQDDGRAIEDWIVVDYLGVMQQLGVIPATTG